MSGEGAEFLSEAQVAAFGRFRGVPSREQLERYFLLDDADRALVARRRGDHNRLGFSVQLTTVRFLGTFLVDPLDVPWVVVEFLAGQLGIADASVVKICGSRLRPGMSMPGSRRGGRLPGLLGSRGGCGRGWRLGCGRRLSVRV